MEEERFRGTVCVSMWECHSVSSPAPPRPPLTLQLLEQEGLATAPLGVQSHTDGRLHGGLTQDVGQRRAVQVVSQHVAVRLRGRQVSCAQRGRGQRGSAAVVCGCGDRIRTGSEDLCQDAFLVAAVHIVGRLARLVGPVQQTAVLGVAEEELGQTPAPPTNGDVEGRVPFLRGHEAGSQGWSRDGQDWSGDLR